MPEPYYYNVYSNLLIGSIRPLYYVQELTSGLMEQQLSDRANNITIPSLNRERLHEGGCSGVVLEAIHVTSELLSMERN
ncbi:hypothetical protein C922_05184 [Plasmodium inui San Antonio 1]|uniref:Uncharacterized protein n=1 Tax=Plasmodium inui San Antonio 1 TaxID=1237626 RepID=W6ZYS9_9APIC|nr:hypothetical protein C922_05184 [Plasmodium inui San Antonio 1]EUD64440.1 hypothetical protein C922_05184 [Plasmodium inui San Antonio 1]